ncbi:hypothetical protein BGW36DRAFT_427162 [Talaromyces proteolyticus]|uniref:Uncharacterized protein n=1 Tax=Talaromyces proteolyticus TaxID=1131652 RepID=A0AAD4KUR4_9EURO|nr:uncharacterized protein BGW36DRAFT_427162 [Talaromyces proteolyticus]KAH8697191.1 hypothetical protein BGW36DRAFT_427162 [Talaromyces proteolyticus]
MPHAAWSEDRGRVTDADTPTPSRGQRGPATNRRRAREGEARAVVGEQEEAANGKYQVCGDGRRRSGCAAVSVLSSFPRQQQHDGRQQHGRFAKMKKSKRQAHSLYRLHGLLRQSEDPTKGQTREKATEPALPSTNHGVQSLSSSRWAAVIGPSSSPVFFFGRENSRNADLDVFFWLLVLLLELRLGLGVP